MKSKILLVLAAGLVLSGCFHKGKPENLGQEMVVGEGVEIEDRVSKISKQFGVTIAENVQKAALNSVGDSGATGLATRDDRGLITILANLPDLTGKQKYTARLTQADKTLVLGELMSNKGGWILEVSTKDGEEYKIVEVLSDGAIILRGEFK